MKRSRLSRVLIISLAGVALSGLCAEAAKPAAKPAKPAQTAKPRQKNETLVAGAVIALPSAPGIKVRWVSPPLDAKVVETAYWYDLRFVVGKDGTPWIGAQRNKLINPVKRYQVAPEHLYNDFACLENGQFLISTDADVGFIAVPEKPTTNYDKLPVVHFQPIGGLPIPGCKLFAGAGNCLYLTGWNPSTEKYEVYVLRPEALPGSAARVREYTKIFSSAQEILTVAGDGKVTYLAINEVLLKVSGASCTRVISPSDYITGLAYNPEVGLFYTTYKGVFYVGAGGTMQVLAADNLKIRLHKTSLYVLFPKTLGILAIDGIDTYKKSNLTIKEVPSTQSDEVKATDIRFFEAGETAPDYADRVYVSKFDKDVTRFMYCQVDLTNLLKGKRNHSQVVTMELCGPGEEYGRMENIRFDFGTDVPGLAGWARFGQADPGSLYPGVYTLKTYLNGGKIDERRITVAGKPNALEAAFHDDPEKMREILDAGADPNLTAVDGSTPIIVAAQMISPEMVRVLLSHKADVNAKNDGGCTALAWASDSYSDNSEMVKLLLDSGADPNIADNTGNTALHKAARTNNLAIMRLLLERGANANTRNTDQETPLLALTLGLHGYKYQAKPAHIELLLSHGADVNATDKDGYTALQDAIRGGDVELVRTLVSHGANVNAFHQYSDGTQYSMLWSALISYDMEFDRLATARLKEIIKILCDANAQLLYSERKLVVGSRKFEALGRKGILSVLEKDNEAVLAYKPTDPWLRKYVLSRIIGLSYYAVVTANDTSGLSTARRYCQTAKERAVEWNLGAEFPEIDQNLACLSGR